MISIIIFLTNARLVSTLWKIDLMTLHILVSWFRVASEGKSTTVARFFVSFV